MKKIKNKCSVLYRLMKLLVNNPGFISLLFVMFVNACDYNYPQENQDTVYSSEIDIHFNEGTTNGTIDFSVADMGSVPYQVIVYPKWISVKKLEGRLNNNYCSIPFEFNNVESYISNGRAEGFIYVRVGKAKIFRIMVSYGINQGGTVDGEVFLYCSTPEVDFGTESNRSFYIANNGQVGKTWYITDIPAWLSLSPSSGELPGGSSLTINCTVNREQLQPGDYSQIIQIESNHPQLSCGILMKMKVEEQGLPVNTSNNEWITGKVQDVCYSKATDYLYVITKSPNTLLVKTPDSDSLVSYPLIRIPNCIDVSVDGDTVVVGYNQAVVDVFDAKTLARTHSFETDCVPFDIELGDNGWCYLAPDEDQWVHLYSLNLKTGVTFRSASGSSIYEKTVLKKMPGIPLLYITRPSLSPSGLLIANIENGMANDTIPIWHEDTGGMIWLSKNGEKIFGRNKEIYRNPGYDPSVFYGNLSKIGQIEIPRNQIFSLDYNEKLQTYFMVGTDYSWGAENAETIYQVNEISFSTEKSVKASSYPGFVKDQYNPSMDVYYVFSNKEGTKLFTVKNVKRALDVNYWSMEIISLPL